MDKQDAQRAPMQDEDLSENERRLLHFTLDCLHGDNEQLIDEYVVPDYIQHTHGIGQGREGLRRYIKAVPWRRPGRHQVEIIHLLAAGDLVVLHKLIPAAMIVDIMRFDEQHRFVEHWDVVQRLPAPGAGPRSLSSEDFTRFKTLFA